MTAQINAGDHWLTPGEQNEVIKQMLRFGILKWDNGRKLPLKSGGTTDIYVNLRRARDYPEAMRFFGRMFCNPLFRLQPDRVAEVPQAVTCFSGLISDTLNLPLVTIRESTKTGRVGDANIIGEVRYGDKIALFDDVITNGASKIAGFSELKRRGAKPTLVVCVDRQQGWQGVFAEQGIGMPVWSGMTLHDIRGFLIREQLMERCDKEVEVNNPIIAALDGKSWEELLPLLEQLRPTGTILKVNDLAADEGIHKIVPRLQTYGRVMVDLKSHDIPNTVANTCKRLAVHNPWACTIHASGGEGMAKAAVEALDGCDTITLAVTVLTSIDPATSEEIYRRKPLGQVKKLAQIAWNAGVRGFVCSPKEVATLRAMFPEATLVTPGVRSPGVGKDEQQRISTPAAAIAAGANFIVGGRQFLTHKDPASEINRVLHEELSV